jgi:glutathione S-transferase
MILYTDETTPFGRKCLVAALERNIVLEEIFVKLSDPKEFMLINPLNQIPALSVGQQKYFDSDVILQFLDTLHKGPPLIPEKNKYKHLTSLHLANAVIESTLLRIMEKRRVQTEQSPAFISHLEARISRGIAEMEETRLEEIGEFLNGEELTTAIALSYVDFRFTRDWRVKTPKLSNWHAIIEQRSSMMCSQPTRTQPTHSPARL